MNEEQLFEKELARAVKIAVERDYVMLEKDMEGYHHTFSDDFKHKMSLLINQERKRVKRKRIKIGMLIAAIILLISTTIVMANDVIRERIESIILELFDDHVDTKIHTEAVSKDVDFVAFPLRYVPDNFYLEERADNSINTYYEDYSDRDGNMINYTQSVKDTTSLSITYDGRNYDKQIINGTTLLIFSDNGIYTIVFEKGEYIYDISTNTNIESLINVFKNNF